MLNATLTVLAHQAGSYQGKVWETFTDAANQSLAAEHTQVVYMLWGSYAQKKGVFIDPNKNLVLKSPTSIAAFST